MPRRQGSTPTCDNFLHLFPLSIIDIDIPPQYLSLILRSGDCDGLSRTFILSATEGLTWPCASDHQCTDFRLMSTNCPPIVSENMLHSFCHQLLPKHQRTTSVLHIVDGALFIIGLVDSSPNIYGCDQAHAWP